MQEIKDTYDEPLGGKEKDASLPKHTLHQILFVPSYFFLILALGCSQEKPSALKLNK